MVKAGAHSTGLCSLPCLQILDLGGSEWQWQMPDIAIITTVKSYSAQAHGEVHTAVHFLRNLRMDEIS